MLRFVTSMTPGMTATSAPGRGGAAHEKARGAGVGRRLTVWLLQLMGLFWALTASAVAGPVCGPGAHWVDACPGGTDFFPLTMGVHTLEIFGPGGGIFTLNTTGPTTIWRGPGSTSPDHHIDTELVSLQLVGGGLTLNAGDGVGNGMCSTPLCSLGRITEQGGNPMLADSFFDIFFEIQGSPLGPLHNIVPCKMETVLDQVAPASGTTYVCNQTVTGPVFLYDLGNNQVGQLLSASHTIILPEPASLALVGLALAALAGLRRRSAG